MLFTVTFSDNTTGTYDDEIESFSQMQKMIARSNKKILHIRTNHSFSSEESLRTNSPIGTPIVFMGINGTDSDLVGALKKLTPGQIYIIEEIIEGNWYTDVFLQGISGSFNSVMFKNLSEST